MTTMQLRPGLLRTEVLDVDAGRRQAEQQGYATFVLPSEGLVDRVSFFEAIRATLPLDPPLVGTRSWDALSDSLWEGLSTHGSRRIAILWPNARAMAAVAPEDFEIAISLLEDVATSLADPRATRDNPKEVALLIE